MYFSLIKYLWVLVTIRGDSLIMYKTIVEDAFDEKLIIRLLF